MEKRKSIITYQVREAINKAAHKGEDIIKAVEEIAGEAFSRAVKVTNKTIDEVEEIVWDVFEGALQAGKDLKIKTDEFMDNAIKGIKEGLEKAKIENSEQSLGKIDRVMRSLNESKDKSAHVFHEMFEKMRTTNWKSLFKTKGANNEDKSCFGLHRVDGRTTICSGVC